MNPCKRYTVRAVGVQGYTVEVAENHNETECKNIPRACGCKHAEIALLEKMPHPEQVYITHSPCLDCAKALVEAGVKQVHYLEEYRILDGVNYLRENGVIAEQLRK